MVEFSIEERAEEKLFDIELADDAHYFVSSPFGWGVGVRLQDAIKNAPKMSKAPMDIWVYFVPAGIKAKYLITKGEPMLEGSVFIGKMTW